MEKKSIGIFDSGVGGLTVFKSIREHFPHEDIIYFGDTARVPYGPKSKHTVINYSIQNTRFLLQQNIKVLIIACNTSSAVAIPYLQKMTNIPVLGVIIPGSEEAVSLSKSGNIGIIGTEGTINSNAYKTELLKLNPNLQIFSQPCPLFVSLVEEGWIDKKVTYDIISEYLSVFKENNIDTLILGCTHYPVLKDAINSFFAGKVNLVDSSEAIIKHIEPFVGNSQQAKGKDLFYVSDNEAKFMKIANMILEKEITVLKKVTLGESWFVE
ncbi:MAG: glutamate racemase [Candidatus Cloacimonadales bacterium]